jgi:hypothetical protein
MAGDRGRERGHTPATEVRILERHFRQLEPRSYVDDDLPRPLSSYFEQPALVVLGDPGAGKTTVFTEAAATEPNASPCIKIRDFLTLSMERWRGLTLYLGLAPI